MEQRLQKILSNYGIASRRKAEQMILDRRVRVNGNTASLGDVADDEEDVIEVDGVRLKKQPARVVLMLNKPRGYVCTLSDEKGRKNVAELVSGCGARVYPVGRLDLNSEGLLLLTNDGELANRLTHPKKEVDKVYLVWLSQYRAAKPRSQVPSKLTAGKRALLKWRRSNETARRRFFASRSTKGATGRFAGSASGRTSR